MRTKHTLMALLGLAGAAVVGCAPAFLITIFGNGVPLTETRTVDSFTKISFAGTAIINVTVGGTQSVEITGDSNVVPLITTAVTNDTLAIGATRAYQSVLPLVITISVPDLTSLIVSAAGNVVVTGVDNAAFSAALSGAGEVTLSGRTDQLTAQLSGTGDLNADNLVAEAVTVSVTGVGSADVTVTTTLDVTITGLGSVRYTGDPTITQNVTGLGSLVKKG